MGSIKVERVREKVKTEVARILQTELNDPRLGFVTITRVDITPDFRDAKVYFSVLGEGPELRRVTRMLDDARGFIQSLVARRLRTRTTPVLRFVHDVSIEKSARVSAILEEIKRERGETGETAENENENELEASDDEDDVEDDGDGDDDE